MDKIQKFVRKLSKRERSQILFIIERIYAGDLQGLYVKKLRGRDSEFRIRKGRLRVVFQQIDGALHIVGI